MTKLYENKTTHLYIGDVEISLVAAGADGVGDKNQSVATPLSNDEFYEEGNNYIGDIEDIDALLASTASKTPTKCFKLPCTAPPT